MRHTESHKSAESSKGPAHRPATPESFTSEQYALFSRILEWQRGIRDAESITNNAQPGSDTSEETVDIDVATFVRTWSPHLRTKKRGNKSPSRARKVLVPAYSYFALSEDEESPGFREMAVTAIKTLRRRVSKGIKRIKKIFKR